LAFAEYDVVIQRDALRVYYFLLDPGNLPAWRDGIRGVELISGAACSAGAIYRPLLAGAGFRPAAADFELTATRPGAELQFQVVVGQARPHGGYYLSTERGGTRVRFALRYRPSAAEFLSYGRLRRAMKAEVAQLERLKTVLEAQRAAA